MQYSTNNTGLWKDSEYVFVMKLHKIGTDVLFSEVCVHTCMKSISV